MSLAVGLLFWPRGAGAALRRALAEAYTDSACTTWHGAVDVRHVLLRFRRPGPAAPTDEAVRVGRGRRAGSTTPSARYLAERGPKPVPLAEMTSLVTGVRRCASPADAVLDMWQRDQRQAEGERTAARSELLATSARVRGWYEELAASLAERRPVPVPLAHDEGADGRFVEAVRHDLLDRDGIATATAVRMIWTGDHLDAARRMQAAIVEPARAATDPRVLSPLAGIRPWRHARATARQT